MTRLYPVAIGLLAGAISSLIAFETVAVLFFALGRYSAVQLSHAVERGLMAGAVFGPLFALLRTSWGKAAAREAGILAMVYLGFGMSRIISGTGLEPRAAVIWVAQGVIYYALSGALAGAATVWATRQLMKQMPTSRPRQAQPSSSRGHEGRYTL